MNTIDWKDKRIEELVDENYVHAYVLFYFGINFFDFGEQTLEQTCRASGINVDQVIREMKNPSHLKSQDLPLSSCPLDLLIEYLKHAHFIFIKQKLPYVTSLVQSFKAKHSSYEIIERDLKIVFPLFVEDFIQHIYDEEDRLFCHIRVLERAAKGKFNPTRVYYLLEKNALHKFASEHQTHDDEMVGIRKITSDYFVDKNTPLHIKVIYNELKDFEQSLQMHARIENDILFPKALALENKVKKLFFESSKNN